MPEADFLVPLLNNMKGNRDRAEMLACSYRDFHAKGLDYVNLHRTKDLTVKAYIVNTPVELLGKNIVNPHDHAYNFSTFILDGVLENVNFQDAHLAWSDKGVEWCEHTYRTSLTGKGEIEFKQQTSLVQERPRAYGPGQHYYLHSSKVHTIRAITPHVVMLLFQYRDSIPRTQGTSLYLPDRNIPDLTGLYNRFTDESLNEALDVINKAAIRLLERC